MIRNTYNNSLIKIVIIMIIHVNTINLHVQVPATLDPSMKISSFEEHSSTGPATQTP